MKVCATVALLQNDKILLTKRKDFEVWCMPGGRVEDGETVTQAAIRETLEETGLEVELTGVVGIYSIPKAKAWCNLIILFTARPAGGYMKSQESEVDEVRFFPIDEIPRELLWGHRQRISDALNSNGGGVAWVQNIPFDDVNDRAELYKLQSESGLSNKEFYLAYFGLDDPENDKAEITV